MIQAASVSFIPVECSTERSKVGKADQGYAAGRHAARRLVPQAERQIGVTRLIGKVVSHLPRLNRRQYEIALHSNLCAINIALQGYLSTVGQGEPEYLLSVQARHAIATAQVGFCPVHARLGLRKW